MKLWQALPDAPVGVVHGFTTREGGVSTGALASLNLALRDGEQPAHLVENWDRVARALHPGWSSEQVALVEQVHGAEILEVHAPAGPLTPLARADAMITTAPNVILGIRVADCVPVLFALEGAVGAAHAGWRGVAADIAGLTLERLLTATGARAADVRVAIGPHISVDAYETGPEVVQGIMATGVAPEVFVRGRHVDLRAAVVDQLRRRGVVQIGHVHLCTASDPTLFSHRAQGPTTGRLAAVIACR